MGLYFSKKRYPHALGLACCFRQHRADSHCRFLHGYSLAFEFVFVTRHLDVRNWVVDFGGLQNLKGWLEDWFDHKTLVAEDDPELPLLRELANKGVIQLCVVPATGCEAFARMVYEYTEQWIKDAGFGPRCWLRSVEVFEHESNSASYSPELTDFLA